MLGRQTHLNLVQDMCVQDNCPGQTDNFMSWRRLNYVLTTYLFFHNHTFILVC